MPRVNEVTPMPKLSNKFSCLCWLLLLFSLNGCMTTPPGDATLQTGQADVPPAAAKEFAQALAMLKSGQRAVALKLFQHLAQNYPQLAGVQVNIGIIDLQNNKTDEAIAALKRASQLNPANAVAYQHLGIAYRRNGQFSEARDAYLQALKLKPDYANAHLNLAILYDIYLQQLDKALVHYKQYQHLSKVEDKQVVKWVIDLERRIDAKKPKRQGES